MGEIQGRLKELYSRYSEDFGEGEFVFGDGNPDKGIVMVGEAPGKDEVRLGRPFVGMAGGNLGKFMDYLNITRHDLYVTNVIKYRLFVINERTGRKSNRPARKGEIESSMPYLTEELDIIGARLAITLGNVPLKAVTGDFGLRIGNVHGRAIDANGITVMPLYHPASLIYNRNLWEEYYDDLDKLKRIIAEVV